jgi:hypothetical protein
MPKEYVYGETFDQVEDEQPVVVVGWSRETEHVQVVTRRKGYEVHGPDDDPIPVAYGMYVDLDRRGINDLIRYLRRARDQAFGRDE